MEAGGSSGPRPNGKTRAAKRIFSDSENENGETPRSSAGGSAKKTKRVPKRPASASDDDELDSHGDDEDMPAGRQRLTAKMKGKGKASANGDANENGNAARSDDEMDDGEEDEVVDDGPDAGIRPEYQRGTDGYVAGSVVRIKLVNFMTYDCVECRPGPHLNMILGPNGTGKSSIAAAIALGLGFHHKTMGRMNDIKGYIKQGADAAEIEIELKAFPGKRNPVIWRRFTVEDERSEYRLNHNPTTKKAIVAIVSGFGVQADNLCCFLAQDKVANFAAQPPDAILKATMKSAGDPRLSGWYDKLTILGERSKGLEEVMEGVIAERDSLQNRVNSMAPDVQHFEERAGLEKQEKVLKCLLIAAKRCSILRQLHIQKAKKSSLKKEMAKRIQRLGPIQELQAAYKKKVETAKKRVETAEVAIRTHEKENKDAWKQVAAKENSIRDITLALEKIKQEIKRDDKARATFQKRIDEAQKVLDQPVEDVQAQLGEYAEAKREASSKLSLAKREYGEITEKYNDAQNQMSEWTKILESKAKHLDRLSSVAAQKEDNARHADGTIGFVLEWLSKNEDQFEKPVCRPPLMSVNVKDRRYAKQLEAGTTWPQRCTFIVQTKNDYNKMLSLNRMHYGPWQQNQNGRLVNKPGGPVRIVLAQVSVDEQSLNPQKTCSNEVLQDLGFAGWASDFVEAEPAVIAFLNEKCGFSRLAVTDKPGDQINADAAQHAGVTKWVTGTDMTTAGRSRYGKKDTFMDVRPIKAPQSFNIMVDVEGVTKLQEEITALKRRKRDAGEPLNELRVAHAEAKEEGRALEAELRDVSGKYDELKNQSAMRTVAARNLKRAQADLAGVGTTESYESRRAAARTKMATNLKDRVNMIGATLKEQETYLNLSGSMARRRLEVIQVIADYKAIDAKKESISVDISDLEVAIGACTADINAAKQQQGVLDVALRKQLHQLGDEAERAEVTNRLPEIEPPEDDPDGEPITNADMLTEDLQDIRVKLDLSVGIDPSIVENYHRLGAKLEGLKRDAEKQKKEFNQIREETNKILAVFDPALNSLVKVVNEQFSAAFEKVGCSGEVQLERVEGQFEKWGIKILVSFRDNEPLDVLTASKQSGGERSLATVTYLMSLSGMSRTPFSLVDEINQGLDQRAERNVHNQLVEVTCSPIAGQYFLITPKLLTDLSYHPKMKILNVNNGAFIPQPGKNGSQAAWADFKGCIQNYRRLKGMD